MPNFYFNIFAPKALRASTKLIERWGAKTKNTLGFRKIVCGNKFAKRNAFLKRPQWPVYEVESFYIDPSGIKTAIMVSVENRTDKKTICVESLRDEETWLPFGD